MRTYQYLPALTRQFSSLMVSPLFDDDMLLRKYDHGNYKWTSLVKTYFRRARLLSLPRPPATVLYIEKEALPWIPAFIELLFLRGKRYVLDFDDAIFHKYDLHRNVLVRSMYRRKIDRLMSHASLVVAGNQYLAQRAKTAGAKRVAVIPTVIDLERYQAKTSYSIQEKPRVVWIGSPSTTQYLAEIAQALRTLSEQHPFTLRLIGAMPLQLPGVDVEYFSWSAESEAQLIADCDIGIMPLKDTPWEQGKCAYKLIQYMASGLPTVSSPVGANLEVVANGETGYFASTDDEWVEALSKLLNNTAQRESMGKKGRIRAAEQYSLQVTSTRLINLLRSST